MTQLEALEQRLHDENISVNARYFDDLPLKGLYVNGRVFLSLDIKNAAEKRCILAEEYCHHCLNCGNILRDDKQEAMARHRSYEMLVPLDDFINICKGNCYTVAEIADELDVTEEVLILALEYYRSKGLI